MKIVARYSQVSYIKATAKYVPRGVFRRNVRGAGVRHRRRRAVLCCSSLNIIIILNNMNGYEHSLGEDRSVLLSDAFSC